MCALPALADTLPRHTPRRASPAAAAGAGIPARAATPAAVSEAPLASLGACAERRFTAWRGHSGRRHVVSVFSIGDASALAFAGSVLIAVTPSREIVALREVGDFGEEPADAPALGHWRDAARAAGATELHVHLLAETAQARREVLHDLALPRSAGLH